MSELILMPRLSDSMEEGTILKWLATVGQEISAGDPLLEIETDKANVTHPAELGGTLVELLSAEGESVKVGAPIARLEGAGATTSGPAAVSGESPSSVSGAGS
ncbi:MAG: 2-oxo acid dehydrogenase subunit E2, partial [Thermoleophilaceae bacterium]|nr:2-oxo acid dehydrogenase subunit E2 [Thermoleophilaceae bacterium]